MNRLANAEIMNGMSQSACQVLLLLFSGDDAVHGESIWLPLYIIRLSSMVGGCEMHKSCEIILITLSKCVQIRVGVSAVTTEGGF